MPHHLLGSPRCADLPRCALLTTPQMPARVPDESADEPIDAAVVGPLMLELENAERVLAGIDDPGGPGETDVGDTVLRLQPWHVVVLDGDATGAQLGYLGADVCELPGCLGVLVCGASGALGHVQVGAAAATEHDGVHVLCCDLQAQLVVVELSVRHKVPRQKDRRDRMVSKHRKSPLFPRRTPACTVWKPLIVLLPEVRQRRGQAQVACGSANRRATPPPLDAYSSTARRRQPPPPSRNAPTQRTDLGY